MMQGQFIKSRYDLSEQQIKSFLQLNAEAHTEFLLKIRSLCEMYGVDFISWSKQDAEVQLQSIERALEKLGLNDKV